MKITAIILASGFSKRFNGNKLLAMYKEKPLIMHSVDKVIKQDFYEVIIVSQYDEVLDLLNDPISSNPRVKAIKNNSPEKGMSESIKRGIKASGDCDAYMFFVGDAPLIKEKTIEKMLSVFKGLDSAKAPILCPVYEGQRGNPVIFSKQYKKEFLNLIGDTGGRQIIARYNDCVVTYPITHQEELMDIDTVLDYKQLIQRKYM